MDRIYAIFNQVGLDTRLCCIIVGLLLFVAVFRLLFGQDKLFSYPLVFSQIWLQRLCRIMFVIALILAAIVIYRSPQIYATQGHPLVVGCVSYVFFLVGVWIFWTVLDILWCILMLIKGFLNWIW